MAMLVPVAWLALGMTVPLSGTVVDAAGRPVAGATVWLGDTIATDKGPEVLAIGRDRRSGPFPARTGRRPGGPGRDVVADALGLQAGFPRRLHRVQGELPGGR